MIRIRKLGKWVKNVIVKLCWLWILIFISVTKIIFFLGNLTKLNSNFLDMKIQSLLFQVHSSQSKKVCLLAASCEKYFFQKELREFFRHVFVAYSATTNAASVLVLAPICPLRPKEAFHCTSCLCASLPLWTLSYLGYFSEFLCKVKITLLWVKGSFCLNNSCANLIYHHHTWL